MRTELGKWRGENYEARTHRLNFGEKYVTEFRRYDFGLNVIFISTKTR